jgi:hypothetical protein
MDISYLVNKLMINLRLTFNYRILVYNRQPDLYKEKMQM